MVSSPKSPLPIDEVLLELRRALAAHSAAVLQAPPGAGKTTRVPLALLAEPWLGGRSIVMLEPRRLAAGNAARWMARLLGEEVGRTVGYAIRFERKISRATRIEVVTEGILTRRLQADPELSGVGLVIFDEFHERSLQADLALALCRDVQQGLREDLRLLVMSATLDGEPVAHLLGHAPVVTCSGRSHPVEIRYAPQDPSGPISEAAAAAVRRIVRETGGDLLVFLPGAGEIRRCRELLEADPLPGAPLLCPLYGDLPFSEQERAILPGEGRKVVLATNIAETSLTIEGVRVVVDGGLERRPRFDPGTGISRLETVRISRAGADQRAGRAGRLGPGICFRLWSEGTHGSLLPFSPPEIRAADLAPLALELARWGVEADALAWLDPPPAGGLAGARQLLRLLGALDERHRLTALGKVMAEWPAHPRLARLLAAAWEAGEQTLGCSLAALLAERDLFRRDRLPVRAAESDLLDRLEALQRWRDRRGLPPGADPGACAAADRAARHFLRMAGGRKGVEAPHAPAETARIGRLLAAAYPDRIGVEREPGSGRYLLAGGQGARLSPRSALQSPPWLVAVEIEGGRQGEGLIHQASSLQETVIKEMAASQPWVREAGWEGERIVAREVKRLGQAVLASRTAALRAEEAAAALLALVRREREEILGWTPEARQLAARVALLRSVFPEEEWPDLSPVRLRETPEEWLGGWLAGIRSRAELTRLDLRQPLLALLTWLQRRRLEEAAPTHLAVPSGHRIPLDYTAPEPPVLAVKLQELFGLADTPRVAEGRVPVLLHLLSPARRPIQVTRDLRGFWERTYPEVKKELMGRYPKHPWPDDPWAAVPTRRIKR